MSLMLRRFAPSNDLLGVHRLNALLDDAFSGWPGNGVATSAWLPAVDVFEDKESLKIVAELPGLKPEDVKITMENNTLTLRGEKKQVAEEKSERVHRYERSYGTFERAFSLPNTVDAEKVAASFENGVLTITLPKAEKAKPREIAVAAK
ncbi:MAG TPA: Hsp20/alpha crystallin family protein [Gemmatimonadales bacterium]|nr:Hsp20/alpha crystallin family protein [Gemmatimonadales bacterium]